MKKLAILSCFILMVFSTTSIAAWKTTIKQDEMGEYQVCLALSGDTPTTKGIDFPYENTTANLVFYDRGHDDYVVYIFVSQRPNLIGGEIGDGWTDYFCRVKFDNEHSEYFTLRQPLGSNNLYTLKKDRPEIIKKLRECKTYMVELEWYGQGNVYFKFDLTGSSEAIDKAIRCKNDP